MTPMFISLVGENANSSIRPDLALEPLESITSAHFIQYDMVNDPAPKRDWNVVLGLELNSIVSLTPSKDKDLVLEKAGTFLFPWLEASTADPPTTDNPNPIIVLYQILLRSKSFLHHHDKP